MFGCDHCAKSFATKSSLTRHMQIYSANPPKCKICINNDILRRIRYEYHMRKVHGKQKNQKENNKSLKDFKKSESIKNDQIEQNLHQNLKNNPLFASTSWQTQENAVKRKRQSSETCPAAKKIKTDATLSKEEQKEFSQLRQQIIDLNEMIECILKNEINQPIQKENDKHTPVENQSEVLPKKLPTSRQSDETEEVRALPKIIVHSVEILPKFIW
ncbi:hypothetical protein PVAND_002300 [Polypedilum vanderplanki]|uniref:C2H2-type domain-containing protein n=1 Tax=Polypedilum vanderplanki TaxID=319348 RepID=A0A9J6BRS0_POLVA|nr:hypothetical protein PVAND_002300 [Polypedilum vanderplanki]